jgi:uncharacterized protein YjbI with pentapeptide repeats
MSGARWRGSAGNALAAQVIDRLKEGRSLEDLGLGSTDGRVDLVELPSVQEIRGPVEIRSRSLSGLDFTRAQLNGWRLSNCEIVDCRFDRARCGEWVLWHCTIKNCTFIGSSHRGSILGSYPEGGRVNWQGVSFAEADLRHAAAYGAVFRDCDFSNARLEESNFHQCELSHCRFAGRIEDVQFDGRPLPNHAPPVEMDDVDFSDAHFVDVDFLGFSLRNVQLPRDPDIFPIRRFPCVARRVTQLLSGQESEPARIVRGVLANSLPWLDDRPEAVWVFNRRDWTEWGGEETLRLAEAVMKQAEADCADAVA